MRDFDAEGTEKREDTEKGNAKIPRCARDDRKREAAWRAGA